MTTPARILFTSKEYFLETFQNELFRQLEDYRISKKFNKKQLAEDLGYDRKYVSDLLDGEFNGSVMELIELSIKIGKVPVLTFVDLEEFVESKSKAWSA